MGCSGWSYDDCVGGFYSVGLAKKNSEWFHRAYAKGTPVTGTVYSWRVPILYPD
jgi:uncharacterized protein YecE (DUF72 family)